MRDYDDDFEDDYQEETPEEALEMIDTFLKQKNIYTWWDTHWSFDHTDFLHILDGITLAQKVHEVDDPMAYFDFLLEKLEEQGQYIIKWLVEQELYEMCQPTQKQTQKLSAELLKLKTKVKQLL